MTDTKEKTSQLITANKARWNKQVTHFICFPLIIHTVQTRP